MKIHIITVSNKYTAWAASCFDQYSNRCVSNCAILLQQVSPIPPNSNRPNDIIISKRAEASKIRNLIAVIGGKNNFASIKIHKNNGFQYIGIIKKAGFKKNKWVDSIYMQKRL